MKIICKKHGETNFYVEKNGRKRCRKCSSMYVSNHRIEMKKGLVIAFGGKCVKCGYDRCVGALDFHHRDSKNKKFGLSERGMCHSWRNVLEEANKCDLLCANCHREIENKYSDVV